MKTIKDLKIGDTVFRVIGYGINNQTVQSVLSQTGEYAIILTDYHSKEIGKNYDIIKDDTNFLVNYDHIVFLNHSEAIMHIKQKICDAIDIKVNDINNEMKKLIELKNELAKYL
jgi:hypothetical protein